MRHITAYDLVQHFRMEYGRLPTTGIELQEVRRYADAHGYDMPDEDDILAMCHQFRAWSEPSSEQPGLFG